MTGTDNGDLASLVGRFLVRDRHGLVWYYGECVVARCTLFSTMVRPSAAKIEESLNNTDKTVLLSVTRSREIRVQYSTVQFPVPSSFSRIELIGLHRL
jgi:hypothetical protein